VIDPGRETTPQTRIYSLVLPALLLVVVISIILLASVPPVSRDALTHHLFVPRLYLEHGGIYEIPEINKLAIKKLKELGHHVAIVTGRP